MLRSLILLLVLAAAFGITFTVVLGVGAMRLSGGEAAGAANVREAPAPASQPAGMADSESDDWVDPPDPVLPDPSALDRAIVLPAEGGKLSGSLRLYEFGGREERLRDSELFGRGRRRWEGRREQGPPPPVIRGWHGPKDSVEWTITVPQAGEYSVALVYSTGGRSDEAERYAITAGERSLTGRVEPTGRGYRMLELGNVTLPAGDTQLKVTPAEELDGSFMSVRGVRLYPLEGEAGIRR